jgi:penicillin-insensitive murein endopeptidase
MMLKHLLSPAMAMLAAAVLLVVAVSPGGGEERSARAALSKSKAERVPAKVLFGAVKEPAPIAARAIGFYAAGCLGGARALSVDGPAWQVMRLSRNRNWGHPDLVALVERLGREARASDGWPGLLVGDLSQPRGGPMPFGHASHQVGLDADIWLQPMPDRALAREEREKMEMLPVVKDHFSMDSRRWTEAHARLIRRAASYSEVVRIFVHPPIKKALCAWATGNRSWLAKVRPYYGHDSHFHIRIRCPKGSAGCRNQVEPRPVDGTGCGQELANWLSPAFWARRKPPLVPPKPAPPLMMTALPSECRGVLAIQ